VSVPIGDLSDEVKMGWLAQVAGGIGSGMLGGRISGTYGQHKFKNFDENLKIIGAMGDLVISPGSGEGSMSPYILAGAGFQNAKAGDGEGETDFAWNAGAGLRFRAGSLGLFVEGRFLSVKGDDHTRNQIPITAGVRIGGN
jgi:hypothetical protein